MAIYHFSAQIISRSNGSSSVGSAAYRSGEKIGDERTGLTHDYTRKMGIEYSEIITPANAPEWANDRAKLWNEVESIEKNKNSQLAREINIALPKELSLEKQIELTRNFAKDVFVDKGMVADISIHDNKKGNPHAHIMLTMRPFENGEWGAKSKKEYILDKKGEKIKLKSGEYKSRKIDTVDWNKKENLDKWREQWANYTNRILEKNGIKERVDHRSLVDQGVERVPQIHVGTNANAMEKRGVQSERGQLNKEIKELNKKLDNIDKENTNISREYNEIKNEEEHKYRFVTEKERVILERAEEIIRRPLDYDVIDVYKDRLQEVKMKLNDELNGIKYEPYTLRDDITVIKKYITDLDESKKAFEGLKKNIFGGYKDKSAASSLKNKIESTERALALREYKDPASILEKEMKLKEFENRIDKLEHHLNNISKQTRVLDKANDILELKEQREFYFKYKDVFPQSKYLGIQGVRNINAVNEQCGNIVNLDKINQIYQEKKMEFKLNPTNAAKDILSIFEKALKSIDEAKKYDDYLQEKAQRQQEKATKSRNRTRDIGRDR